MKTACAQAVPGPETSSPMSTTATPQVVQLHDTPAAHKGFDWMSVLPMVLIFVVFYFFMIRPQQKKMKQQRDMLSQLKVGDHVITTGGFLGEIRKIEGENRLQLDIADGVCIKILRSSVSEVIPRGESSSSESEHKAKTFPKKSDKPKAPSSKKAH